MVQCKGQSCPQHIAEAIQGRIGKAFMIWLNCSNWLCKDGFDPSRIGTRIN